MMVIAVMGEEGSMLDGSLMEFVLAPFRSGRELDGAIDEFIDAAPQMSALMGEQNGDGDDLAEANKALAEAEMQKAQAAMAKVQADSQLRQAEGQRKMAEFQQKAVADEAKHNAEIEKLRQTNEIGRAHV